METTVCVVTFACEWVFLSAHDMMTSVTGSNISLPKQRAKNPSVGPQQFCLDKHIFKRFFFCVRDQGRFLEYLFEVRLVLN